MARTSRLVVLALSSLLSLGGTSCATGAGKALPPGGTKGMLLARYEASGEAHYGMVEGDRVRPVLHGIFHECLLLDDDTLALDRVKLLYPTTPTKILAVGRNYRSHLGANPVPEVPELFFKPPSALISPGEAIVIPPGTNDVHFEAELVIVIGKRAKDVPKEKALEHVLGVTCGNDVSARDWQKKDLQWWRAKGADTFAPCGPFIASGINYDDLLIELRVNGEVKQKQRTSDLIHDVSGIVSWASRHVTLEPGDLIYTGTPGQTSALKPGDVVEVEIEGIGILKNGVVAAPAPGVKA